MQGCKKIASLLSLSSRRSRAVIIAKRLDLDQNVLMIKIDINSFVLIENINKDISLEYQHHFGENDYFQ